MARLCYAVGMPNDPRPPESADLPLGQQLCTACGMCCSAALHDMAMLQPGEIELAKALGLEIDEQGEEPRFSLPCPQLRGTACGAYESRPRVCGRYRCQLLMDVEDEGADLAPALDKVATAKRLLGEIDSLGVAGLTYAEARAVVNPAVNLKGAAEAERKIGDDAALRARVRLQATALMVYIDRHFREHDKGTSLDMSPVTASERAP